MNTTMTFEQRYVQARRRFIEADFANLNDMQRKAVLATEGPLLLLAYFYVIDPTVENRCRQR